jgi:hypothetical protein
MFAGNEASLKKKPKKYIHLKKIQIMYLRDRPFNLKGGVMVFCFVRKLFFFCRAEREFFFQEFNIRLYDKNSESDYYFFPPPKSEYFFQQHWESEYFFRKNP